MEYTSENIEQAVSLFYKTDSAQQATAHQWLTDAQSTPHAWSFVWDLLDPRRSSEVQFFAATTLHIKLIRSWHEIPVDYYQELRKKIVDCIVGYATGPKLILNRLCITLSAYIIHTVPTHWPNAFGELIANFQPHNLPNIKPERVTWILLEILSVIPEEFHSSLLSGRRRLDVKCLLCNTSKDIVTFVIQSCLANPQNFIVGSLECNVNMTTQLNVMKCLLAWIQLGHLTIADLSEMMSIITNLVCYVYWTTFTDEDVLDAMEELELIEVALEILQFILNQGSTYKYPTYVVKHMYEHVSKFGQIIEVEKSKSVPNREVVAFMLGLIINTSDSHCKKLIEELQTKGDTANKKMVLQILDIILSCSDSRGEYPIDETDSFLPFTFWYTFQEEALSIQSKNKKLLVTVKSYYQRLVLVFLKKSAYSPQWGNHTKWSLDDRELFRCYRQDIADTFLYCYNVLNIEMLALLLEKLNSALLEYKSKRAHWSQIESCLHAFMSIAETIIEDNQYIPQFLDILRTIPYNEMNRKVLAMALDNVSAYSEWLADHPDLLDKIMPLLVLGMSNTVNDVATSATFALKDVACNCIQIIDKYAENLIRLCHENLANSQLRLTERMRVMQILGYIISVLPADQSMYYLQVILGPLVEEIQTLVNSPTSPTMIATLITKLKLVSSLFITLNHKRTTSEAPVVMVVQSSIPLYAQVAEKYFNNEEIMQVLCELLKYTLSGLMSSSKPLVPSIFQLLLNAYIRFPNVHILNLSRMILVLFGKDADMHEILNKFLIALVENTLRVLIHLNNCCRLSDKSDIVEGFFVLLGNVARKTSCQINSASNLEYTTLFQCAIVCLGLPEPATLKACVGFITEFIMKSRETGHTSIVQNNGEALVHKILINLGGAAARSTTDLSVEMLFVLNKKYCDDLSRWLNVQLNQKDFPSSFVSNNQKQQFMVAVLREKSNKRRLLEITTEFTLICRQIIKEETPQTV